MAENTDIKTVKSQRVPRIDGALKVTGRATYTSDHNFDRMLFAVPVCATIAKGKIKSIDESLARRMNGVAAIYTHKNIGALFRVAPDDGFNSRVDEARPPFEDEIIRYYGQYVALVVAETFETAQAGARAIKVSYADDKANTDLDLKQEDLKKVDSERGDAQAAFQKGEVTVNQTYTTPNEFHNPIEMHATVAKWGKDSNGDPEVVLYETSQAIHTHQNVLAQILGLPKDRVRVVSKFLGSGFGGKLWAWPHSALAAQSSRLLGRPVKLVIDRKMMFTNVGYRPHTQQTMKLSATKEGKLTSLQHHYATLAGMDGEYKENCGEVSSFFYNVDNVKVTSGVARRNVGTPTSMRGPGAVPGLYALESAMDELAIALHMDPVKLRLVNDTEMDGARKRPFSSRHFKECLELGSERFGWAKRNPQVGSMRDGDEILGWGVAGCTWMAARLDADAVVDLNPDGRVRVSCSTHDIGTGMYTVLAQIASEELKIPIQRIDVVLGDTQGPAGPLAGGSMATGSVIPAVVDAVKAASAKLLKIATKMPVSPYFKQDEKDLKFSEGVITSKKSGSTEFGALIKKLNVGSVGGKGSSKGSMGNPNQKETMQSFGAHFIEIGWNPKIARLKVRRVVTVIDGGRIINYQPAMNQIQGAVVMGIGMGLFEHGEFDRKYGYTANANLADYVMTVHADMPDIDVTFLDYPDKALNSYGARGIGEIGLAGVAPAICSAVYHATGIRVRDLPVKIEDLLRDAPRKKYTPIVAYAGENRVQEEV
jgi:xanthine dehydrogenase YagR molybdenum-binding subunit